MGDDWDFYLFDDQGAPASNFLNMALVEDAPIASQGVLGLVEITMLTPRPDGLSSDTEADALYELEDAIVESAVRAGAINCGRTTGRGVRTLAFYVQAAAAFDAAAQSAIRRFPAYVCDVETKPDAEWRYYFDFLFPSREEWNRMRNQKVLQQLDSHGDDLSKEREIDHWVYFDAPAAARAFAESVKAEGFVLRVPVEQSEDGKQYCVQFWRIDFLSRIDALTKSMTDRAEALGGEYDGWECPVER